MSCGGRGGVQEHPRRLTEREYGSSTCSLLLDIVPSALTEFAHPLLRAATAPTPAPLDLAPLPSDVTRLLADLSAPPHLAAHLRAVHDVALRLLEALPLAWPALPIDAAAVAFGAATHDIGKALHPSELTGPGSCHERDGYELLVERGVSVARARFARTHARWNADDATLEDQLVSLADKIWKGRREEDLEQLIVVHLARASGRPAWEIFSRLDEILEHIAADADERLAFQGSFAVGP